MILNIAGIAVLVAVIGSYVINLIADLLNVGSLKPEPPAGLDSLYDPKEYARSQTYTRDKTRLKLVSDAIGLVVLLIFWVIGGFGILDEWIRGFEFGFVVTGLLYIATLIIGQSVISTPFDLYGTFVLEERYGFNKTTWGTWVADRLKGLALSIVIGVPILAAVLAFFHLAGPLAWLYCWILISVISLAMQYVAPTWIMPLFNTFEPLADDELHDRILTYAKTVDYPLESVFMMDGSKRSSKGNAFFTGFGKKRRVALFDTLIEKHSTDELVAIVAHEIGHYKKCHILISTVISILHTGVLLFLLSVVLKSESLFAAFSVEEPSIYVGLVVFGMLYAPVELLLSAAMSALSRKNEFEADRYSAETTGRPDWLSSGLKRLTIDHLGNLTPHPFYVWLHYSHPPLRARLQALEEVSV